MYVCDKYVGNVEPGHTRHWPMHSNCTVHYHYTAHDYVQCPTGFISTYASVNAPEISIHLTSLYSGPWSLANAIVSIPVEIAQFPCCKRAILPVNLAWQWRQSVFYGEFMESAILHNIRCLSFSVVYKCRKIPSYDQKYTLTSLSSKVDREYIWKVPFSIT